MTNEETMTALFKEYHDRKAIKYARNGMGIREANIAAKYQTESLIHEIAGYERSGGEEYALNMLKSYVEDVG